MSGNGISQSVEFERLDLNSMSITEDRIAKLREDFPEVFREDKIDFDALKRSLGEWVDPGKERFGLNWPGKADCMRIIQEPSVGTLVPMREESVDFDTTKNVIIEGENLEVLKLLQKSYYGKVKMIYIDPPYNTGSEFIYPDNFKEGLGDYLRYSGQVDGNGLKLSTNTESEGRYHSKWLNMMYPRLFLARNLLREDGAIFVSIDDHEVHGLRWLLDLVFGEENFVGQAVWQKKYSPQNDAKLLSEIHEYIIGYARNTANWRPNLLPRTETGVARYKNPDNDPRGPWKAGDLTSKTKASGHSYPIVSPSGKTFYPTSGRQWAPAFETYERMRAGNRIWFGPNGNNVPAIKQFLSEVQAGTVPTTLWLRDLVGDNQKAVREVAELGVPFDAPKPTGLVAHISTIGSSSKEDIILDFFAGSGTTAHAIMKLNEETGGRRRYILVQLPELLNPNNRDHQAAIEFCQTLGRPETISEITKERVRRAARSIGQQLSEGNSPDLDGSQRSDLGFRGYRLTTSNFKPWEGDSTEIGSIERQLEIFSGNLLEDRTSEDILTETLLKSGFELTDPVERVELAGKEVFSVAEGAMLVCLERELSLDVIEAMAARDPWQIVVLDAGFNNNDQLKVNAVQAITTRARSGQETIAFKVV